MDFLASNLLVPTNSRRRTKGRLPFVDSAEPVFPNEDEKLENEVNIPENELEYDFSENLDDVDEEQVTIDLSEFLNENPLLTEPSENLTDSGATLTDCHSQFRVTSSLADPTPVPIDDLPSQKDLNVNEPTIVTEKCLDISETVNNTPVPPEKMPEMPPNVLSENNTSIDSTKILTDIVSNNISPHKENILIGVKSSPNKNHKAKSTKSANLFQKYKNISKLKDFNKNNMEVFGKYPVVKCERLDIENFIKTNSIKVRNWPIMPTNNHFKTKTNLNKNNNVARKCKSPANKVPKLLNKPISFNRCDSNSQNLATVNKARSILIDALAANSSPLIIKTDSWKPEIANLTGGSTTFVKPENFQLPAPPGLTKPPGSRRIIKIVHASSPLQMNKFCAQSQKFPIITNVNKVTVGSKTFQLVSPNTFVATKTEKSKPVTPILPKPNTETISPVLLKDYTVIQPYVEDPTSPVKPKPLLTVPLDIVPVANAFNPPELYSTATEIHSPIKSPLKSVKPVQSVFLNGAINQISSPITVEKELLSINMTDSVHCNEETTSSNDVNKTNDHLNTDMSIISSKSTMIDAITSVFSKSQIRKQPKSKQNNLRSHRGGDSAIVECKAYNTTLNDMLFNDDFTDESYSLDDSIDISSDNCLPDASNNILQSSQTYQSDHNFVQESSTVSSSDEEKYKNKIFSKQKCSKKKIPSPHDSDTLSASEGEEENNPKQKRLSYTKRKHRKLNVNTLHNRKKPTDSPKTTSVHENPNISSEKTVMDISFSKNATNSDKRNRVFKKAEADIHFENSSESLKLSEEKCHSTNKPRLSKTSKIETSYLSNATSKNDEDKLNNSTKDDTQEKVKTVKESKTSILNLRNRHKSTLKGQTAVALVKSKRIGCIRAKFKVNSKKPSNNKMMHNNKKSSRTSDIIEEIKTITGGNIFNKKLQTKENSVSEKINHSSSKNVCTRSKNESKAKTVSKVPKQTRKSLPVRSKTKKRIKTLKVLFKRPAPKQKSKSLEMPFDDINLTLLDNETDPNFVSENNTNLHSTFRDSKSHKMDTPVKEDHKCDADVLPTELKSDDSLKENILKENELLSNGIDNSSVENSVGTESEESLHGENNICISEEIKSCSISGKVETPEDISQNEKSKTINSSYNKQQTDTPISENLSSSYILKENDLDISNDSNLVMPSTEHLLNNVSEDADLDLREKFQAENSSVSVHGLSEDITNENKISSDEEILEHIQSVDTTNVLKEDTASACENVQEFACKSNVNTLFQDDKPEINSYCDNSCNNTSVSDEIQKNINNPDSNIIIEESHEAIQTCHKVPEYDLNNDVVESNKIDVATENLKMNEHNFDDAMLEDSDIGKDLEKASVSEEIHDNDHIHVIDEDIGNDLGNASVSEEIHDNDFAHVIDEETKEIIPCDEIQKKDHNPDDNKIAENINEINDTCMKYHDSINNSASYKVATIVEKIPKENHNSEDNNLQNALDDSKIDDVSSHIKDYSFSEIEEIPEKKRGRKPKRKSCPKIKLSVAKKTDDLESVSSSKNWYISERKESTDSTQSEEQHKKDEMDSSKRGRKTAAKSSFPVKTSDKNERICFETVAEIHAVDTDINPSCGRVSTEINVISNFVNNDSPEVSSKENEMCSEVSAADLSSNTCTRLTKFVAKRKSTSVKPSTNILKIKEEPAHISGNSALETTANIKLENEEITKAMDEITVDTSHSSSRRKGQPSSTVTKKLKIDTVAASAPVKNQIQKKVIKKPSSKGIADSPNDQSAKLPDNTGRGTPTSCPKSRKKSYSPKAVIVPFSLGWMRELVHRSTEDKTGKRMSDVYYFSPEGTKLRSMIEISNYLSRHPESKLTIENFTFWKELVYREPFEIERSAKQKSAFGTSSETSHQTSIKKYIKSTAPNNNSLNSSKEKSQKINISVENKNTPAFAKEKRTKTSSNSDEKVDTIESEKNKNRPASSKEKQKTKIASNSDGKVDIDENENKNRPASSKEKQKTKTVSNSDGKVDTVESEESSELPVKSPVASNAKKKSEKSEKVSSSIMDTVENSDNVSSRSSRKIVKKVPFDNSESDNSQPRAKRGRPSKSLNTSVPELEITKTVNDVESSIINTHSNRSKQTETRKNSSILIKNDSKSTATKRRPKLNLVFSKNNYSGIIQPPCSVRCAISIPQRPTIQCAICLCLFHPNCIPKLAEKVIFACKSCTLQKLALYEKERKPFSASEPSLPDDSLNFDSDIDMSLLSPEVILNEQTGSVTLPLTNECNVLSKNSSSNIPQGPSGIIHHSSDVVKNVQQGNRTTSSPHLLSHLLKPTARLNSSALTVVSKPTNQNLNSSSHMLITKETASRLFQCGVLAPGTNISAAMPLAIKKLPDGRKIAVRSSTNILSSLNNINNSASQNPISNINPNIQILCNISEHVNGNLFSSITNQSGGKASGSIGNKYNIQNVKFVPTDRTINSIRAANLLTNLKTKHELNSKNCKSSSTSNNTSESSLFWDMNETSCKYLLNIFKRLSIPDLLRAGQVCSSWKHVASQSVLWERVSFQGLSITNWEKCCLTLKKNGTKTIDLHGIVQQNMTNSCKDLEIHVVHLAGIEELTFDQITPSLLKSLSLNLPLLRKFECHFVTTACSEPEIWTVPCELQLSSLRYLGRLVKLKIGSGSRIELKNSEEFVMPYLPHLRHVTLTGFNFCSNVNLESLSKQKELISLELGDCKEIEPGIYSLLENLTNLKRLRLENGGNVDDYRLSEALLNIKGLEVLELMNFKISKNLSESLSELKHLIHLNVWPDNTEKGLVALFPESRVEMKWAARSSWKEFCSTRK
ncbi:uncharacterized protein LOC129954480 isoform X2 [Argiope bruennichi]|uniref:uncharacterized protein LOC129954480 isoform X2 n=1 Tax=Argiope bruennichi TaxID=94029 RepID=UPI002494215C|nr:uncharacterized protein LOC129954480 isoform X2 [Argiope bruennichi]